MRVHEEQTQYPLEPALDFLQHLWQVNHAMERMSLQMERTIGVTAQQRLFIRCIGKFPGMTASQLAALLHVDRGTVSTSLRRLARKGLVTKRQDPRDQRRLSLGLTTRGQAFNRPTPVTVEHHVEQLLAKTGRREIEAAKAVLLTLSNDLSAALPVR